MSRLLFNGSWEEDCGSYNIEGGFDWLHGGLVDPVGPKSFEMFSPSEYRDFIDGKRQDLVYLSHDGKISIEWFLEKFIRFTVSRFGDGTDGETCLSLPADICREAFEDLIRLLSQKPEAV